MLRTLRIQDLVIIDDLTVDFGPGLNLLTGETGAGKSILVDALGLAAGARGERELVRNGAERAVVEAVFETGSTPALEVWARACGVQAPEEGTWFVRRELPAAGSGRVFINGSPSTVGRLRELGGALLELHGQHEHQVLLAPEQHLAVLDRFGDCAEATAKVEQAHRAVRRLRDELAQLAELQAQRAERTARLERDLGEIVRVAPRPGERDELDRERQLLRNAESWARLVDEIVALTYEGEPAAASLAAAASTKAAKLAEIDPAVRELGERIESAAVELQDAGAALRDYREAADFDPSRLEQIEARRVELERLCLLFGRTEQEVIGHGARLKMELDSLRDLDQESHSVAEQLLQAESAYVEAAAGLGRRRRAAVKRLVPAVEEQLRALALGQARFGVELRPGRGEGVEIDGKPAVPLAARGAERVEFVLAANPGEPMRPLGKVASGGELSRVMLALHAVVEDAGGSRSLVFDEVDAGVGGAIADAVGARLSRLAERHQVLCVTHLPQVAAYANRHFVVRKHVADQRTRAEIVELDRPERIEELARMLAGKRSTPASRRHATELLGAARRVGQAETGRRA